MADPIHQEVVYTAKPEDIYAALTDAKQFSRMSGGAKTDIDPQPGGAFSCFDGMVVGRNIECAPARRLVQAWRVKSWPEGVYSIVRFELHPEQHGTRVVLDHRSFPEEQGQHLDKGWHANYWEPLRRVLNERTVSE